jgi:signal peptidase I
MVPPVRDGLGALPAWYNTKKLTPDDTEWIMTMQTASSAKKPTPKTNISANRAAPKGQARPQNSVRDMVEVLVMVAVIFLGFRLSLELRPISGPSMEPGILNDQNAFVNKLAYLFGNPQRGDVIIFHPPTPYFPANSDPFIKRIIGLPGDTVVVTKDTVSVNGVLLKEPYIASADNCTIHYPDTKCAPQTTTLGPNQYWVMGDNRPVSDDSRVWGPLNRQNIIGKASFIWWPLSSFHAIDPHRSVFAKVPAPRGMTQTGDPLAIFLGLPFGASALRARRMFASER